MKLVIIDLTDGLLVDQQEGTARPGAAEMLEVLLSRNRLGAFEESSDSGVVVRSLLNKAGIGSMFETVVSSADLGIPFSPAAVRMIAAMTGIRAGHIAVITARPGVAEELEAAGIVALPVLPAQPLTDLPQMLAWLAMVRSEPQ